jgi:hypothetical protein
LEYNDVKNYKTEEVVVNSPKYLTFVFGEPKNGCGNIEDGNESGKYMYLFLNTNTNVVSNFKANVEMVRDIFESK